MNVCRLLSREDAAKAYPCATETPTPFWAEGLPLSRDWFAQNLGKHVEGFHLEEAGEVIGHIYWAPSERALVPYRAEPRVAWIYCEWVQRPHQGRGHMHKLFEAFLERLRSEGYKGVLVGATNFEGYMHHSHFTKRGFRAIHEDDGSKLLYLPLTQESVEIEPLSPKVGCEGAVLVEILVIGSLFCPVGATTVLYLRRVAAEFSDRVAIKEVPAGPEALARYGVADGIFLNGEPAFFGPVTEEQVRAKICEELES